MIKSVSVITFKAHYKTYYNGENKVIEYFTDDNKLSCRTEYDKFNRDINTNWFDEFGNNTGVMHKNYLDNGYIETCKTNTQEYTRTVRNFVKNGFKHRIEEYISTTKPEKNYCNENIRDMFGKLVKMISNGKVIFDKKL